MAPPSTATPPREDELVAALCTVPGVTGAGLSADDDGGAGLLRLDLAPGVDEVTVATSVGRLLRQRFGLGVDAERVQLVEDAEQLASPADVRLSVERMHLVSAGREVTATVTLGRQGRTAVGEARGSATQSGVHKAVAAATVRAANDLAGGGLGAELSHVDLVSGAAGRSVRVALTLSDGQGRESTVAGAAVVRADPRQAVIRAVLGALSGHLRG